jgi:predicted ATPase/DNA-binding CsgD family transcriptional regulator
VKQVLEKPSAICPPTGLRTNLPVAVSSFVGREEERDQVGRALDTARLVTLVGAPGVGKTRLALELAADFGGDRPDGVWLVELPAVTEPDHVVGAIAGVLGISDVPGTDPIGGVAAELADKRLLLVLDSCEHLLTATATAAATLLRGCAGLVILATSREPLGIDGECVWRIQPFALPPDGEDRLEAVLANSAVQLFVERAAAVRPGFRLTAADAPAVVKLCRRLDGVPLAVELAAARMDVVSPHEILEHLGDRLRLGTRARRDPSTRQTLEETLDWSHRQLLPNEATLLGRLTVFAGGWNLEAAEAVCGGGAIPPEEVLGLLDALVRKSLVTAEVGGPETRYHLIGIIRDHAGRRLSDFAERAMISDAHCRWYVGQAKKARIERRGSLMRLDAERDNLHIAFEWAMAQGQSDNALALAGSLEFFWQSRGAMAEGRRWLARALEGRGGGPPLLRAHALCAAGHLRSLAGDVVGAVPLVEESLALAEEEGDASLAQRARSLLNVLSTLGSPLDALPLLQSTAALAREQGDLDFRRSSLEQLGAALVLVGEADAARRCLDESLNLAREHGEVSWAAGAMVLLGRVAVTVGDFATAEARLDEALTLTRQLGELGEVPDILCWLGEVARCRGNLPRAEELLGEALRLARESALCPVAARCLCMLGHVALAKGESERARAHWTAALSIARPIGRSYVVARCLLGLGEAALEDADGAAARIRFEEALALARSTGDRLAAAAALHGLGVVATQTTSVERALALHHEALSIRDRIGDRAGLAASFEALALLAGGQGEAIDAARFLAAAQALRDAGGYDQTTRASSEREGCITHLRLTLGEARLSQEWEEGSKLSAQDAIAYATRSQRARGRPTRRWASLTPAEHDVACLAAEGLTSREIGERLFISPRTVGAHLGHVFEKLAITSRRELRAETPPKHPAQPGGESSARQRRRPSHR